MNVGPREYRRASLRIAIADGVPEDMRERVREILSVQSSTQRQGDATALMWQTCAEADMHWITLLIHVKPFSRGMDEERLERWYAKFGFIKIQDKTDDGAAAVLMARNPQRPAIQRVH